MTTQESLSGGMKPQKYKDDRPAEYFEPFHEWARTHEPNWVYMVVRWFMVPFTKLFYRVEATNRYNIPLTGPVIVAPNHASNLDHFLVGRFTKRRVRFMAKSNMFKWPMHWVYRKGGVFPVRRGVGDEESIDTAKEILSKGGLVLMYPQGGRLRSGSLRDVEAKHGVGRLALEMGVPVVPAAIHNSEKIRNWKRLQFPKVRVVFGEPINFAVKPDATMEDYQEVANRVMDAIKLLHAELSWKVEGIDVQAIK